MKEIPEPINVSPTLKAFLTDSKSRFKRRLSKFYSTPSILMYYLKQSESFVADYTKYCENNDYKNELIKNE